MPNLNNLTVQDLQWGTANWSGRGYIDGLIMQWVSGTALSVSSGAAFIESLSKNVPVATAISRSGLSLSASTWYHVYLYLNAGAADIDISTTAPASAYSGTARSKAGDASRRYIGSIKTDGSGNLFNFAMNGLRVNWYADIAVSGTMRILSAGVATTPTTISASAFVPVTSKLAALRFTSNDTGSPSRFSNSESGVTLPDDALLNLPTASPGLSSSEYCDFPLDSSQAMQYSMIGTPSGAGVFVDVCGYIFAR